MQSSKGKEKAAPASNIEVVVVLDDTDEGSSPVKKPKKEPKAGEETVKKAKKEPKEKVVVSAARVCVFLFESSRVASSSPAVVLIPPGKGL